MNIKRLDRTNHDQVWLRTESTNYDVAWVRLDQISAIRVDPRKGSTKYDVNVLLLNGETFRFHDAQSRESGYDTAAELRDAISYALRGSRSSGSSGSGRGSDSKTSASAC